MPSGTASVGLVGAGAATQAIHLPTLARLPELFQITKVADVDQSLAAAVAGRVGATAVSSLAELVEHDAPDVVVVCSPNQFHAEQVTAACRAGVGAVLCEKPLATSLEEAEAVAQTSRETGVPVVVGTMHSFDPVWVDASRRWVSTGAIAHTVRIAAHIPPNPRTEDFATQVAGRPDTTNVTNAGAAEVQPSLNERIARLRGGVLGLAIHDLPLARQLLPDTAPRVIDVEEPVSGGYLILCDVGGYLLEVRGGSSKNWLPDWQLEATADNHVLHADFGASYVHAGSAIAELIEPAPDIGFRRTRIGPTTDNGYMELWRFIGDLLAGRTSAPNLDVLVSDLDFAARIADQAAALLPTQPATAAEVNA